MGLGCRGRWGVPPVPLGDVGVQQGVVGRFWGDPIPTSQCRVMEELWGGVGIPWAGFGVTQGMFLG